jgi:hypothetical protein
MPVLPIGNAPSDLWIWLVLYAFTAYPEDEEKRGHSHTVRRDADEAARDAPDAGRVRRPKPVVPPPPSIGPTSRIRS